MLMMPYSGMLDSDKLVINREVEAMKDVNIPFIVKFIEHFVQDDFVYMVTDYANGGTLEHKLQKSKLKTEKALQYLAMMCLGLAYIHERELVHRDISPKNIFVSTLKDGRDLLIIGDFGLVRSTQAHTTQRTINDAFSLHYAAPEQVKDDPDKPTFKFDVWAIGVILHQMLDGEVPFKGQNRNEQRQLITSSKTPEIGGLDDEV